MTHIMNAIDTIDNDDQLIMKAIYIIENADLTEMSIDDLENLQDTLSYLMDDVKQAIKVKKAEEDAREDAEIDISIAYEDVIMDIEQTINDNAEMRTTMAMLNAEIETILGESVAVEIDSPPAARGNDIESLKAYLEELDIEHKELAEEIEHLKRLRSEIA